MSPYQGLAVGNWPAKTEQLISEHPLKEEELVIFVKTAWDYIFESSIGPSFKIGHDLSLNPQSLGALLHQLVPLVISRRYPETWRGEQFSSDKDIVCIPDDRFSIELKTSSHKNQIFGNRSYAQDVNSGKKSKSGYYLTVNFEKINALPAEKPEITLIRFGWLDHSDWIGQESQSGQQARLSPDVYSGKLKTLYCRAV